MRIFSVCRSCGGLLMVAIGEKVVNTNVHEENCVLTRPTRRESLSDKLNEALLVLGDMKECLNVGKSADAKMGALKEFHLQESIVADLTQQIAQLDNAPPRFLDAALRYASWGWPVFPLGRRSKHPAISKAKGGNGVKDATTDPDRIKRYWTKFPDHNVGIATGYAFDVIDVDAPHKDEKTGEMTADGRLMLPQILGNHDLPDAHGVVLTARGGMHYYMEPTGGGNKSGILPGVDYRGLGGYVVAPPSRIPEGRYVWSIPASPKIANL